MGDGIRLGKSVLWEALLHHSLGYDLRASEADRERFVASVNSIK